MSLTSVPRGVPTVVSLIPQSEKTLDTLLRMYEERVGEVTDHIKARLDEYAGYIKEARKTQGDWFYWMHKGIFNLATRTTVEQRSFGYLLGMYKSWLTYGFGTYYSAEFEKLKELFTEKYKVDPSPDTVESLHKMVQDYGLVHATAALLKAPNPQEDLSAYCVSEINKTAASNYQKIIA